MDPDRFGYVSLHYVARLTAERQRLVEYARFGTRRFEIQVRSILQHAWAEIEHDLGYKSVAGVPRDIRRRFSRIAGLLELADDEFCAIRRELGAYAAAVPAEIQAQPETVGIDKLSLAALLSSRDSATRRLSQAIADAASAKLVPASDELVEHSVKNLTAAGLSTIAELETAATSRFELTRRFAKHFLAGSTFETLTSAIALLYVPYVLISERNDEGLYRSFIKASNIGGKPEELIARLRSAYAKASRQ